MNLLIKISENDKRIIIAIAIILILLFVIFGYLGLLVNKVMKMQAKKAGIMMHDVVAAKVVTTEHDFRKLGFKKNNQLFAKQALIPMAILGFAAIIYVIYGAITRNWLLNILDYKKEGFSTLLFLWDFPNTPKMPFFGGEIICGWPPILNTPHWENSAWASYIIFPAIVVGGIWLLIVTQAHIARSFRLRKLSKTIFHPSLDNAQPLSPLNNQNNNNQSNL